MRTGENKSHERTRESLRVEQDHAVSTAPALILPGETRFLTGATPTEGRSLTLITRDKSPSGYKAVLSLAPR